MKSKTNIFFLVLNLTNVTTLITFSMQLDGDCITYSLDISFSKLILFWAFQSAFAQEICKNLPITPNLKTYPWVCLAFPLTFCSPHFHVWHSKNFNSLFIGYIFLFLQCLKVWDSAFTDLLLLTFKLFPSIVRKKWLISMYVRFSWLKYFFVSLIVPANLNGAFSNHLIF